MTMTMTMTTSHKERIAFALMLLTAPAVVYALTLLRPTFDDWTYTTYPNTDPDWWKFILPYGDYWRPFDGAFGYVVAMGDRWFPTLNHLCVYLGHALATLWVWLIARRLGFHPAARLTAATIHYVSPAILGTLLSIDSLNQTYACCWGLAALWVYLSGKRHAIPLWLLLCAIATLCKENGAMWLFISPWVGWLFNKRSGRQACQHLAWAMGLLIVYATIRFALPNCYEKEESAYLNVPLAGRLANAAKYVVLSYTSFDFVSVFHRPSRNVPYLLATLALSAPYFALNLLNAYRRRCDRRLWGLVAASLVAVAPHLLTLFSAMHAYAGLAPLALLAGWLIPQKGTIRRTTLGALVLYVVSAIAVDARHWEKAYQSGMDGYQMALETIRQTHKPTHRVHCICVDHGEAKYSSFCVIPYDSYGWGNAVLLQTGGKWPQELHSTITTPDNNPHQMAQEKLREGYDHVWIVDGKNIQVIER